MTVFSFTRRNAAMLSAIAFGLFAGSAQAEQRVPFAFPFLPMPGQADADQTVYFVPPTAAKDERDTFAGHAP